MTKNLFYLKDRRFLITGGCGLLGTQHGLAIAHAGGIPILVDLNISKDEEITNTFFSQTGIKPEVIQCDITDESSVERLSKLLSNKPLHGLINNAAVNPSVEANGTITNTGRLENYSIDSWNKELAVSLTGTLLMLKHCAPLLIQTKGVIINISSDLGLIAPNNNIYNEQPQDFLQVKPIGYSVTKSAMLGFTKYMSTYWAHLGVRCNAICPGGVENGQDPAFVDRVKHLIPLGRMAHIDEYHGIIVFLLSDAAYYLNGAIIPVDGGRTAW